MFRIQYPIHTEAVDALLRVQKQVPEAIVAGGCLRDSLLGRPINDIDIFVPDRDFFTAEITVMETHPELTDIIYEPYFAWNNDVKQVRYYAGEGLLPVNLIAVYNCTPEAQLARFDFGICKVAWDSVRLWKHTDFDIDARDETFTLLAEYQTEEQRAYSMGRYERLQAKYRGWRFIDATPKPLLYVTPPYDALPFGDL